MSQKDERIHFIFAAITSVTLWEMYLLSRNISTVTRSSKKKPQEYKNLNAREWETLKSASYNSDMCNVCSVVVDYAVVSVKLWFGWYPWLWHFIGSIGDFEFFPRVIVLTLVEIVITETLKDSILLLWADSLNLSPEAWAQTVWKNLNDTVFRVLGICGAAKLHEMSLEYFKSPFLVDYSTLIEVAALVWLPFKNWIIRTKGKHPARTFEARQHWPVIYSTAKTVRFPSNVIRISRQGHIEVDSDWNDLMDHVKHTLQNKSWFMARKNSEDSFQSARGGSFDSFHSINSNENIQSYRFDIRRIFNELFDEKESKEITYHGFGFQVLTIDMAVIEALPPPQLNALFIAELARWKYRHQSIKFILSVIRTGLHVYASTKFYGKTDLFGFNTTYNPYLPKLVSELLMGPVIDQIFYWIMSLVSCYFDFIGDQYAASQVSPVNLSKALEALAGTSSKYPVFDSAFAAFHLHHPTIPERLRIIKSYSKT